MKKVQVLSKLQQCGLVAVIRGNSKKDGVEISKATVAGEIKAIEVAYTTPNASGVIEELTHIYKEDDSVVIGAGTVLDVTTARLAILSGADFVVSPSFDEEVAKVCNLYQIPYLPGCMTITEINTALAYGVDIIKVFPGDIVGPRFIKDVKGPLPHVNLMPTGGVSLENMQEWFDNGVLSVGIGSNLTKGLVDGNYDVVTKNAKVYVEKLNEIRGN
ncbi:bifunctional 4-hydroxy-2-oxoglutarate aldolase/2-dehydro-3-deoxy-phosphogluconate aldolase [Vagococcus sp. JNUCC 83]